MNIVSVALPTTGFSAVLSLQTLDTNGPIGFGVGNGLTASDTFALYGTLDNLAVDASNAYDLGRFGGSNAPLPAGFAKQASTWPFLLAKRLTGSGTGSLYVGGNPLTLPSVVTTAAPTTSAAFSAVMNLTTLNASQIRIGGSREMTANDSFDLYLSNDATIATTSTLVYVGRFTGGGGTNVTSFAVSGFAYAVVQRVAGSTAGTVIAAGIAPSVGGSGGSVLDLDTLSVGNTAVNGAIGGLSAAASVDIYSSFLLRQTTAGIAATLPSPTVTTAGKVVYAINDPTATQAISMYGMIIGVGAVQSFQWAGAEWVGGKNITQGGNAFGAAVTVGSVDNQPLNLIANNTTGYSDTGVVNTIGRVTGASGVTIQAGTGPVDIATNATDHSTNLGSITGASATGIHAGLGGIGIGVDFVDHPVTVGSTIGASATTIRAGASGVTIQPSDTGPLTAKSGTTGAATFDSELTGPVNVGTGANAKAVTVGSVTGAASTALRAGSGGLTIVNNGTTYSWPSAAPTVNGQKLTGTTAGPLTWSGVVNVQANNSTGQSIPDGGGATIVTSWSEVIDSESAFAAATGVFTAPVTGFYQVCCELEFSNIAAAAGSEFSVQLYVNGALVAQAVETCQVAAANVRRQPKLSIGVPVTAGQTLDIRASQTSGSGANSLTFTTQRNLLSISLVS